MAADLEANEDDGWASYGIFWGVLVAFVAGVALSLTPCVYPMIGITVAVIGGQKASKGRTVYLTFLYILGLSLVYAAVGVVVALAGSAASSLFRSVYVLVPIGVLFVVLGLSMFDLFTLQVPASLASSCSASGAGAPRRGCC